MLVGQSRVWLAPGEGCRPAFLASAEVTAVLPRLGTGEVEDTQEVELGTGSGAGTGQ